MKNTKLIITIAIFLLLAIVGGIFYFNYNSNTDKKLIGGDKDSHGCLIGAGYSWNESEKACVREWSHDSDRYQNSNFTESQAIFVLKNKYPELNDYPSDKLAPKSIKTEKADNGWYVGFVQEGSGIPIISAKCFFVDKQRNIMSEKLYNYSIEEDFNAEFSAKTCSMGACSLETCHGLDIKCGSNPADICTAMYQLGDKCIQYAKCGIQNNKCQEIENPQFSQCKFCVLKCIDNNKNDNTKQFDCENKCI